MLSTKEIKYQNEISSVQLSNNFIDLVVAKEFGPRILHLGLRGQPNMLAINPDQIGTFRGSDEYHIVGGHRLWTAPEDYDSTYIPDNTPVELTEIENGIIAKQPSNDKTPLEMSIQVELSASAPVVELTHTIKNNGVWTIKLAPWAITVMDAGGVGILPLPPRGPHGENLLANGSLVFWAYTNFADPRCLWGFENICLKQDTEATTPLKFGMTADVGWIGYANHNALFVKKTEVFEGAEYPDFGTPYQIFTNHRILECESMGPLTLVEPGQTINHKETWALLENVALPINDQVIKEDLTPRIQQILKK